MMRAANNKRLLLLKKILFEQTDENNELSIYEIKEQLQTATKQPKLDLRTIKQDMESLQETGFDIIENRREHGKIYYSHQAKLFETYQIRLLIDAILSARFFTNKEKTHLINNLKQLTSTHVGNTLPKPMLYSQTPKIDFGQMRYNIDKVNEAIVKNKLLSYQYGSYNINKAFELRRGGERYVVAPYVLIWQNDQYYLIGEYQPTCETRHYRLDRMRDIEVSEAEFKKSEINLKEYIHQSFHMFSGKNSEITLRFSNQLVNSVLDRFGTNALIEKDGEDHFLLKTEAKVSEGLKSWILRWGSQVTVLEPDFLVKEIKGEINKMYKNYLEEKD